MVAGSTLSLPILLFGSRCRQNVGSQLLKTIRATMIHNKWEEQPHFQSLLLYSANQTKHFIILRLKTLHFAVNKDNNQNTMFWSILGKNTVLTITLWEKPITVALVIFDN
ncbi:hypothetical protein Dimus_015179 [Dionaea muscipula]